MARKTIAMLEAELATLRQTSNANYESGREWRRQSEENEKALKEARSHFSDLKQRLLNAETETARLRGYLSRVHEDDIVRDGLVEIEDANGKRHIPRRPPPMEARASTHDQHVFHEDIGGYGERRQRTHWTSY